MEELLKKRKTKEVDRNAFCRELLGVWKKLMFCEITLDQTLLKKAQMLSDCWFQPKIYTFKGKLKSSSSQKAKRGSFEA